MIDIYEENYQHADIDLLAQISRVVMSSHLKYTKPHIHYLCQQVGISLYDLAIDSFAEIFETDSNNRLYKFTKFFHALRLPIYEMPKKEIFLAWKSFLLKISNTQIAHIYAQHDPVGFKLKRNIRETVPLTKYFILSKNIYGTLLSIPDTDIPSTLPYMEIENISTEFLERVEGLSSTRELLKILHDVINEQTNSRKEIRLTDAVQLFKKVFRYSRKVTINEDEDWNNFTVNSSISQFEIDQICSKVLYNVKEKILLNYYSHGKLTKMQSEALYTAMSDLIFDWAKTGGNNHSLYDYFNKYLRIDENDYHVLIRDKIEYLVKIARKEFALYLLSKE